MKQLWITCVWFGFFVVGFFQGLFGIFFGEVICFRLVECYIEGTGVHKKPRSQTGEQLGYIRTNSVL